jgi:hypothetical protein
MSDQDQTLESRIAGALTKALGKKATVLTVEETELGEVAVHVISPNNFARVAEEIGGIAGQIASDQLLADRNR